MATALSRRPHPHSALAVITLLLVCGLSSRWHWSSLPGAELLSASKEAVFANAQVWRLFTTTFVHGDLQHLLSNSYMLSILSFLVFGYYGARVLFVDSIIGAAVTNALSLWTYEPQTRLVAASGLVYYLAGFWLTVYLFVDRRRPFSKRVLRALGVGLIILFPTSFDPQTSYRTHALGAALGALVGCVYFAFNHASLRAQEVWQDVSFDSPLDPSPSMPQDPPSH